ncbi:MAG: hypothetical protein PQJ59_09630 [Spirochaetales bacterium]|nr:hypothetical protein [Spirochaetales bacterium]
MVRDGGYLYIDGIIAIILITILSGSIAMGVQSSSQTVMRLDESSQKVLRDLNEESLEKTPFFP